MFARLRQHWVRSTWVALCSIAISSSVALIASAQPTATTAPSYTADGRLDFPKDYRKWVFLSSGHDMSYLPSSLRAVSTFGNVFVNREAHEAFLSSGTWPDKTVLVLEVRRAEQNASINKAGHFQADIVHTEVHVKDAARFRGGWAFFGFTGEAPATMIPQTANCYSCHQDNGAVDTTFVQFYPTLLPIAQAKKTLASGYLAGEANAAPRN